MTPPICPRGHGEMMLVHLTQGDGKDEISLGYVWFCVNNDESKPDYCDEAEDVKGAEQLEMEL